MESAAFNSEADSSEDKRQSYPHRGKSQRPLCGDRAAGERRGGDQLAAGQIPGPATNQPFQWPNP